MPGAVYQCQIATCGYIYNPKKGNKKQGIPKGTEFEELPEDWTCPLCGASKKSFKPVG